MKETTSILDIAYPHVEQALKKNISKYRRYMSKFINSRSKQLYSNKPSEQIYFKESDVTEYFDATGIDKKIIKNAIQHTYYWSITPFNPRYAKDEATVTMLCAVRYFLQNKMQKDLEMSLIHMSFSGKYYPSIFYGSFKKAPPKEYVMDYVINYMCTNKFDIIKYKTVVGAVGNIANKWVETYKDDRFKEFSDDDAQYLIQQLHNRIRSFMNNIAELYYAADANKDLYITFDSDNISDDNYHLANNDAFKMEKAVSSTMAAISGKAINYRLCKMASNDLVKFDELRSILENLIDNNDNIPIIKEFISLMIACYFRQYKNGDLKDIKFISFSIMAKPNSKDQYILRQRELLNIMLINNSEHFARRRNRVATESAYYRAINSYFALMIQVSN